jgi:uracil-DNA glycosylase family 4
VEEKREIDTIIRGLRSNLEYLREIGVEWIPTRERGGEAPAPSLTIAAVRAELGECTRCKLWQGRRTIVFGEGNEDAALMFIGEGPGADEDIQGRPFVGRAGQLLTKIIEAIDLVREDVYIANIVKCRPPNNRVPEPDEAAACIPFLRKQIASIRPQIIVALGAVATNNLFSATLPITKVRGEFREMGGILVMPTFHPSYLLRNPASKREVWEDMKKVRDRLRLIERSETGA